MSEQETIPELSREERVGRMLRALDVFAAEPKRCDECEVVSYDTVYKTLGKPDVLLDSLGELKAIGWRHHPNCAGIWRPCFACAIAFPNAWALDVDAGSAVDYHDKHFAGQAMGLAQLRCLLPEGHPAAYKFPVESSRPIFGQGADQWQQGQPNSQAAVDRFNGGSPYDLLDKDKP